MKDIRNPVALGYTAATIERWRRIVFEEKARFGCVVCGGLAHHLHEGIVWRSQVMGMPWERRGLVFADCNSFCICSTCHQNPPPREWFWAKAHETYSDEDLRNWYASIWVKSS